MRYDAKAYHDLFHPEGLNESTAATGAIVKPQKKPIEKVDAETEDAPEEIEEETPEEIAETEEAETEEEKEEV